MTVRIPGMGVPGMEMTTWMQRPRGPEPESQLDSSLKRIPSKLKGKGIDQGPLGPKLVLKRPVAYAPVPEPITLMSSSLTSNDHGVHIPWKPQQGSGSATVVNPWGKERSLPPMPLVKSPWNIGLE